ncbi:MAG TPA: translocation/assembly module TamB [Vicinamibacterales bacterium]|nr:translocation/assembly module TamB [Vicinamibacterales bacterium]
MTSRRLARAVALATAFVVAITVTVIVASQTAWFKNWLRGYVVRQAGEYLNGTITIGRLGGNLISGIELENIVVAMDGHETVAIQDLLLNYSISEFISSGLSVDRLQLNKPRIYLRREGDDWSIGRLLKDQEREADREGPARPISVDEIVVTDGSIVFEDPVGTSGVMMPRRFDRLDATLVFHYEPVRYSIDVLNLSFRGSEPTIALNELSGGISVRDDTIFIERLGLRTEETSLSVVGAIQHYLTNPVLNLRLRSEKVSLRELSPLVPVLEGVDLQPGFALAFEGPLDRLKIDLDLQSTAGDVSGNLITDVTSPGQAAHGTVSIRRLDIASVLKGFDRRSDVTAEIRLDLRGQSISDLRAISGTVSFEAPRIAVGELAAERVSGEARIDGLEIDLKGRASAYGASATAAGTIVLPEDEEGAVGFDLRGQARDVDLQRLPRSLGWPSASTDINTAYRITGSTMQRAGSGVVRTAGPPRNVTLALESSTVAGTRIEEGSSVRVAMNGSDVRYEVDAGLANLDLQRLGAEFRVPALAADRYQTSINGHVTVSGRGIDPREMDLAATGVVQDTSGLGARIPQMSFEASIAQDTAHLKASGSMVDLDPAIASGRPALKGDVDGTLTVEATLAALSSGITAEQIEGTARVELVRSTVGALDIETASFDGDYRNRTASVRALEIVGPDLNIRASGLLALNEVDESSLQVHAASPSLEKVGMLVHTGSPLAGIGAIDLTVTGNRRALRAAGTFSGSGVKYAGTGALVLSSEFRASVPNFDVRAATASATTRGTFVALAGQNINELAARTEYDGEQITFDASARQPGRALEAAGAVVMHPDHQEVHLRRLLLTSQGITWQTAPGAEARIRYATDAVSVSDVSLVNGAQQISASGSFGNSDDRLNVSFTNIDVGTIDALLLRPPQLSGLLSGTSTLSGSRDAPEVHTDFTVDRGAFRQFVYDSFTGSVDYTPRVVTLDTTLQQNPSSWIQAKGTLPTSLVRGTSTDDDQPIDLRIDSTPLDVALVQGLTTAVANVTGTIEAHVHVTGSAADPRPDGVITIDSAAFKLVSNGVVYSDLDGRVELQPDRVHIQQLTVLDNRRSPLNVTGDLAIRERKVGEMSIAVAAEDFKVVDNQMGNVRVNANLQLTGQVNAPRLEGQLDVTTGEVNLDPILALLGSQAYATTQTEFAAPPDAAAPVSTGTEPSASVASGVADPLQVDVRLTVPNDLVIRGADWRTPGSPISLGDLNLTLGGDVYVHRVPYDRLRLYGAINTVRGTYAFQSRQFTILRGGTVRFDGLDDFNPELDVRAERIIQGVTANVNVRGSFNRPELVLTSVPPLDQADILSLIVFNQPINQLGTGDQTTLAERAQALATGAVASQLASSIGNALGVDAFEISTAPDSGAEAEITIGQQIGQDLYVRVQHGIGEQAQTNFILEYELADWLRLQTNVVQGSPSQQQAFRRQQSSGADLLFFFSY